MEQEEVKKEPHQAKTNNTSSQQKPSSEAKKGKSPQNLEGEEGENQQEDVKSAEQAQDKAEGKAGKGDLKDNEEDSFKSKFFYLAAEMENYKRRSERERDNLLKFGNEKILTDLIEVMDNFERTVSALQKDEDEKIKNIVKGIDMVGKQFLATLKKYGLGQVESVGKTFDPNVHEALSQIKSKDRPENEILEEYQRGYTLNGRLIRPAKVSVAVKE